MAIEFNCPYCTTSIRVPDAAGGKKGKCPRCEHVVQVPKIEIPTGAVPAAPEPEPLTVPEEPEPPADDAAPARPGWMNKGAEAPASDDPSGFVEAPPDGPPDFSALADAPAEEPLIRTDAAPAAKPPAAEPAAAASDAPDDFPSFGGESETAEPAAPAPRKGPPPGKRVRRRRKKPQQAGVPPWVFPVVGVAVLGGLLWWWAQREKPDLEGVLKAEAFGFLRPPASTLDATTAGLETDRFSLLVEALEKQTLSIKSDFMRVELRGRKGGIEARVVETRGTRFVKVLKSDKNLKRFLKESAEDLDEVRGKAMKSAAKAFADVVAAKGLAIDGELQMRVRNDIALNVLTGPLGANLVAKRDGREFPCCYEDGEGVYFLLPLGAKSFEIEGREFEGDGVVFEGRYTVASLTEIPGEMPDDYVDPWNGKEKDGGGAGNKDDEAPPLSGLGES